MVYKQPTFSTLSMESSQPIHLSNILSEDYKHFESTYEQHPQEAKVVFSYVADLRAALQAFREATIGGGAKAGKMDKASEVSDATVDESLAERPDVASLPVLTDSGSVETEVCEIGAASAAAVVSGGGGGVEVVG